MHLLEDVLLPRILLPHRRLPQKRPSRILIQNRSMWVDLPQQRPVGTQLLDRPVEPIVIGQAGFEALIMVHRQIFLIIPEVVVQEREETAMLLIVVILDMVAAIAPVLPDMILLMEEIVIVSLE